MQRAEATEVAPTHTAAPDGGVLNGCELCHIFRSLLGSPVPADASCRSRDAPQRSTGQITRAPLES